MLTALVFGMLTAIANLLGSSLSAAKAQPSPAMMASALAFSGGFLLAAALLEIVPEAIEGSELGGLMVGAGFLLIYLTEHLGNVHMHQIPAGLADHAHGEGTAHGERTAHGEGTGGQGGAALAASQAKHRAIASFVAFNVHDLMDGIAIGAAIITDPALGIVVFLAVLLHELPAGFAVGTIIRNYGGSRTQAMLAGLSIGLVTIVGILIPFAVGEVNESAASMLLGIAGGTFIYIGASILIPTAETGRYRWSFVYVALGFAMFAGTAEIAGRVAGA